MSFPPPQPVIPKAGGFNQEPNTFSSINDLFRFFAPLSLKVSKNSPPGATDLKELQFTFDKTTKKLWIQSDGAFYSVQFS